MSGSICLDCNLCCDGSIFDVVAVTHTERDRLGQGFSTVEDQPVMCQPCVRLGPDGGCRRYADRPAKCAAFDCALLRRATEGAVDVAQARAMVARAKTLRDVAKTALNHAAPDIFDPSHSPATALRHLAQAQDAGAKIAPDQFDTAKHAVLTYAMLIEDHFHRSA